MSGVKTRYLSDVLNSETARLKNRQENIAAAHKKSGYLLIGRFYNVQASGLSGETSIQHPIYERFIDMRSLQRNGTIQKRKQVKIHNKLIWKTYGIITSRLMNGFADEAAESIRECSIK